MTTQARRYRVTVDFQESERETLAKLCNVDFRLPDDQLRYLVVNEAKRRGLLTDPPDPPKMNEGSAKVYETRGASPLVQS